MKVKMRSVMRYHIWLWCVVRVNIMVMVVVVGDEDDAAVVAVAIGLCYMFYEGGVVKVYVRIHTHTDI